jgi:hypothetical protein
MANNKLYIFYKRFALTFIFFITESTVTAFLFGVYFYFSNELMRNDGIEEIIFKAAAVFMFRLVTLQAFWELIIVFLIIYFSRWENFWIVFSGVLISVLIWGLTLSFGAELVDVFWSENGSLKVGSDGFAFGNSMIKAALTGYGSLLFSGTLFAWWLCYKKIGLKV